MCILVWCLQILAHQIDLGGTGRAQSKAISKDYPPKFTITVNGDGAMTDSTAEITFTGIKEELTVDILLKVPFQARHTRSGKEMSLTVIAELV